MNRDFSGLKPALVWKHFVAMCAIPHPSHHEEKIRAYVKGELERMGYACTEDEAHNLYARKEATPGMENRKGIVIQAHLDMVPQKNNDKVFDFEKDPIDCYIDGEWVTANGTTLGADNGIGVAAAMAVLADKELKHGPVNCLFTIDEETGLTGAEKLTSEFLQGDILVNLDSEDEGEMFIGCAGGVCNYAEFTHGWVDVPQGYFFLKVDINSLTGGHSGDDINKERANANKLMARFINRVSKKHDCYLCEISGGSLHNAIPRDASAVIAVPSADKEAVRVEFNIFAAEVQAEYSATEPTARFTMQSTDAVEKAIDRESAKKLLLSLQAVFNGVYAMSADMPGLVETSSNLASVKRVAENKILVTASQRSSVESARDNVSDTVRAAFELGGAVVTTSGGYPGWKPNVKSEILKVACETYKNLFAAEAKIKAIHAGLECGLFLEKAPQLDMISFGPTMRGVHSPDERLDIASTERWWRHLVALLENAPQK